VSVSDSVLAPSLPQVVAPVLRPRRSTFSAVVMFCRRNPLVVIGAVVVLAWVLAAIFAPLLAPYGPLTQKVTDRLKPPSPAHLFGTDELGRDILSRVIYGARISIPVGVLVVVVALVVGGGIGALAGYGPGWLDTSLMRVTEMVMAFPIIILAMTIAAALGPGLDHAVVALVAVSWPRYSRVIRGLVLSVKENEYVMASRAMGGTSRHVLLKSVLPNCLAPAVVMATLDLGGAILTFAGLSFLGLGSPPPAPEWGAMVAAGTQSFDQWWVSTFPGAAILTLVMAFNFVGDGVRDALDPRLRRRL
jgi:peptide/nickel transport system permease protein